MAMYRGPGGVSPILSVVFGRSVRECGERWYEAEQVTQNEVKTQQLPDPRKGQRENSSCSKSESEIIFLCRGTWHVPACV